MPNRNHGMTAYEVGASQGHSKEKVDKMIKSAKKEGKALVKKTEMATKLPKGYGSKHGEHQLQDWKDNR